MRMLRNGRAHRWMLFAATIGLLLAKPVFADTVSPSERVTNYVNVRLQPSAERIIVGRLHPNERAEFLGSVPHWYRVRLGTGVEGFVAKAWTTFRPESQEHVPFEVHFLDVGTGDAAIIDLGEAEIVIDGGDSVRVLHDYAQKTGIIDDPIELVVVTHGDSDHWRGFNRLLGFDEHAGQSYRALEFWEPGYDRDCRRLESYTAFIQNVQGLPNLQFRRPLEQFHTPSTVSGQVVPISISGIPHVTITVLHTDATPEASNGDCAYRINNASIVLIVEVSGVRFLFTGDANGKERNEPSPGTPGHIEAKLLALEHSHPGLLKSDVLKVPHHGSETASTQDLIDAVDPRFVIISASTRHHLPRPTVVQRYENGQRIVLRTDVTRTNDNDHIICSNGTEGVSCNYWNTE